VSAEALLHEALGGAGELLSVLAVCDAGRVTCYAASGDSKQYAPAGAGPLLELIAEAARRAETGVFSFRDPDGRTPGFVVCEPIESTRVLIGIALGDRDVAALRLKRLALQLRLLG
jgi:hypothetical protein